MAESNDVKAIESISAAVGESEVQIILSNQCMKAQAFLVNRLTREYNRQKEIAKFISSDNLKLEAEIKNSEQEIKSLMLAHESIKSANVELKKVWQLAKELTQENAERIQSGEKKYEELWEQCKSRYESIRFVQNWLQATKKKDALEENINILDSETEGLLEEIKTKENIILELDKKRIIELAEYFVNEKPKIEENLSNLSKELKDLNGQLEQLMKSKVAENVHKNDTSQKNVEKTQMQTQKSSDMKFDDGWPNLNKNTIGNVDTLVPTFLSEMPKLQLMNIDLDVMSVKLDQIKKSDSVASPLKDATPVHSFVETPKVTLTRDKSQEHVSLNFLHSTNMLNTDDSILGNKTQNYSKRKLINILEDIKLETKDTYNLVSKVNKDNLQGVSVISASLNQNKVSPSESTTKKDNELNEVEAAVEEIEATANAENIIMPPSGFLDHLRSSQEKKKRVSFELPTPTHELHADPKKDIQIEDGNEDNQANVTATSEIDQSVGSEESFTRIKDMILKKHNLDLSPQFVYNKNTIKIVAHDEVVKSNYFQLSCEKLQPTTPGTQPDPDASNNEAENNEMDYDEPLQTNILQNEVEDVEMPVDQNVVPSGKENQQHISKPVTGLLFSHGPQGLPESLDISISTTGFEEGDTDYPQFSSLLLSPKADLQMPSGIEKVVEPISQEVPNFLSGLRKTGLSFFGKPSGTGSNTDNGSAPSGSNSFNFAFGSDDKKSRGGLFNMFN